MPPLPRSLSILLALWLALTTLTTGAAASPPRTAPETPLLTMAPLNYLNLPLVLGVP